MDDKTTTGFINEIITAFINEIPILVVGLIIAYCVHLLQNKTGVIMNKAWIEDRLKLNLKNTIEIIDSTKELKSAISKLSTLIVNETTEMLINYHKIKDLTGYYTGPELIEKAIENFNNVSIAEYQKIENFIFLLERDIKMNVKKSSINNIKQEIEMINNIKNRMKEDIVKNNTAGIKRSDVFDIIVENKDKYERNKNDEEIAIETSIKNILDIYIQRLDKKPSAR